ncbi:hypothetical protein [Kitasatospora sp. MAP5-34]|uniref:hypothetical protein n=1 Tax=Kitasatospora sp. MAP5-34 TaxID=3035102 RepID=UPI0024747AA5|nr:hypothetical protein [Kitasatospora sp. MAP5-34]MDH6577870.1 Tol biopolymer transport system component [Kitasatospora sp. MAP5-34]
MRGTHRRPKGRPAAALLALVLAAVGLVALHATSGAATASTPAAPGRIAYGGTLHRSIGTIDMGANAVAPVTVSAPLFPGGPQHYDDEVSARGSSVVWTSLRASALPQVYFLGPADVVPVQVTKDVVGVQHPALAPGGRQIAFAATTGRPDGQHDLWVVNPDGTGLRRVTDGTGDNVWPTWSPDGTTIAFSGARGAGGCRQIYSVPVNGGDIRQLTFDQDPQVCADPSAGNTEPDWDPVAGDRRLLFTYTVPGPPPVRQIKVMLVGGGESGIEQSLLTPPMDSRAGSWSPDGTEVAFLSAVPQVAGSTADPLDSQVYTTQPFRAPTDAQLRLAEHRRPGTPAWYLPPTGGSELVVARDTAATPGTMDLTDVRPDGSDPRDLLVPLRDMAAPTGSCEASQQYSPDGRRIAFTKVGPVGDFVVCRVWIADADGTNARPLGGDAARPANEDDAQPAWSPDGTRIALTRAAHGDHAGSVISVLDAATGHEFYTVPTPGPGVYGVPAFSPDGSRLAFAHSVYDGQVTVHVWSVRASDGTDPRDLTAVDRTISHDDESWPAYSPDGRTLVVAGGPRIGLMDADGRHARTIPQSPGVCAVFDTSDRSDRCSAPSWSPDGTRLLVDVGDSPSSSPYDHTRHRFVVIMDPVTGNSTRLTGAGPGQQVAPTWQPTADLSTAAEPPAPTPTPGGATRLVMAVTNQGPAADPAVQLTVALPAGLHLTGLKPDAGSCRAAEFHCDLGTLKNGQTVRVTAELVGDAAGSRQVGWSTTGWVLDPDLTDNHAAADVPVPGPSPTPTPTPPPTPPPGPDPAVRITAPAAPAYVGGPVTVTYLVTNRGGRPASGVRLLPVIPTGLAASRWPAGCDPVGGCPVGDLAPGASAMVQLVIVPGSAGTFDLAATATTTGPDTVPADSRAAQQLTVRQPVIVAAPPIGPPGFVTSVRGRDFPPGLPVTLAWRPGITAVAAPAVPAADGSFTAQLLIMSGDDPGARSITATGTGFATVGTPFLVETPSWGLPSLAGQVGG